MTALLALALLLPLSGALLPALGRGGRALLAPLLGWAALPALALALLAEPGFGVDLPWLLTGLRLGLDTTGKIFLLFTALLWTIAGLYARGYLGDDARASRFAGFFHVTCAGNLGLILAQDVVAFYLFYALMTFAAYGLVVHSGTPQARRAAQVYIVMAVLGEALLLIGFLLLVGGSASLMIAEAVAALAAAPKREAVIALLLAGFGVKAGALLLHMWLPLAHPVAPTPASAVLSGAMIKAGLLGWLRFLPLGAGASDLGLVLMVVSLAAAYFGVAVGVAQRDPKVILAYSSISQMGLIAFGVGLGLYLPETWPLLLPAVILYAFHHALTKGALFLGVGVLQGAAGVRRDVLGGLGLLALALAGIPFTGGALAKDALKAAASATPWPGLVLPLLTLSAAATALLMARLLWRASRPPEAAVHAPPCGTRAAWWLAFAVAIGLIAWLPVTGIEPPTGGKAWAALWPVLAASALAYVVASTGARRGWVCPSIEPGDVLWPFVRLARLLSRPWKCASESAARLTAPARLDTTHKQFRSPQQTDYRLYSSEWNALLTLLFLAMLVALLAFA